MSENAEKTPLLGFKPSTNYALPSGNVEDKPKASKLIQYGCISVEMPHQLIDSELWWVVAYNF